MKEGYKDSPIGEIPQEWEVRSIEDIADVKGGKRLPKGEKLLETPTPYPYIRVADMYMGGVDPSGVMFVPAEVQPKISRYIIQKSDLFISVAGTLGLVGKIPKELDGANLTENADRITNLKANQDFLLQVLLSPIVQKAIEKEKTNNAQPKLALTRIKKFHVPYPPFPEQKKIATILSTVDEKIAVIEERIQATQELKKGLMQRLLTRGIGHTEFKDSPLGEIPVGWKVVRLGQYVEKVGSGITPKGGREAYVESGVKFIRSQNVLVGKFTLSDVAFISEEQHLKMSGTQLLAGDVLLNITGASIGRSCIVPEGFGEANVNQHVCIIRPGEEIESVYLSKLLNSPLGQNQINRFQAGGNREGLNFQQIRSFKIPLPTIEEQISISKILSTVEERLESLGKKRQMFKELKKGLMQQLLTGKTRVKMEDVV